MSVALSAMSSFCIFSSLSSNNNPPVKSLIGIALVVQDLILLYRNSGEWRLGREGGGGVEKACPA